MVDQAGNNKRIAKNTLLLYVRMLFSMFVSLYTSRVVLNVLGVEDFGIYNVVGGVVAMFSLLSGSLSASVSRFLTFELGRGDTARLKRLFTTALWIHACLGGIILLLAETLGLWFLNTRMTIPPDRLYAANWVFQASVAAFLFSLLAIPYNASIISHERMGAFAYIGMSDVLLRLSAVLLLAWWPSPFDRLILYALLILAVTASIQLVYMVFCRRNFEECRSRLSFDKAIWKEMGAFAGWNFIGSSAGLLKDQGVNVLLNLFTGPVVNAARGIAMSVNTAVSAFAGNFMTALNPQITKSYALGEFSYMMSLVERGARFSFYIMWLLALPVLFETEFVLTLWLKQYPDHTVSFVRLVLIVSMCDVLSNTLITLQTATGKIRNYQLAVGGMLMMNFPLSYVCLYVGFPPESTLLVALSVSLVCLLLRLVFLRSMVGLSVRRYLKNVCWNVLTMVVVSVCLPLLAYFLFNSGWIRFMAVSAISLLGTSCSIFFIGCTKEEQRFVRERVVVALKKRMK